MIILLGKSDGYTALCILNTGRIPRLLAKLWYMADSKWHKKSWSMFSYGASLNWKVH